MTDLISIIVPVYNTRQSYLARCVDSALGQRYENFEVIVVDDGSADETREFCDALCEKDSRIRVFHKANGGVSSARNYALESAKGDWVTFLDADDELAPEFLATAIGYAEATGSEAVFGHTVGVQEGEVADCLDASENDSRFEVYRGESDVDRIRMQVYSSQIVKGEPRIRLIQPGPCAKLFKTAVIGETRFDENLFVSEDRLFTCEVLGKCDAVAISDEAWYLIHRNAESTTRSLSPEAWIRAMHGIADATVPERFRNALIMGCYSISFIPARQLAKAGKYTDLLRYLRVLRNDSVVGWKADIDFTKFSLSRAMRLMTQFTKRGLVGVVACALVCFVACGRGDY